MVAFQAPEEPQGQGEADGQGMVPSNPMFACLTGICRCLADAYS